jgi:hypothetical protein
MFERYTEKARRAVFFARYEASQYGNPCIETEHLLLGLYREDCALRLVLDETGVRQHGERRLVTDSEIRAAIEQAIGQQLGQRTPISTATEVPFSADSKKALLFASEEAERLGQRQVGTEHMLLGLLRVEGSLGAQIVRGRGLKTEELRERIAKSFRPVTRKPSLPILEDFLAGLKCRSADDLMPFFARKTQVVDVHGNLWNYEQIAKNFEMLFVPYAKKNASYTIEETLIASDNQLVALVLWKNALVASMERVWMHRMTVVLVPDSDDWAIVSMQVTPVQP